MQKRVMVGEGRVGRRRRGGGEWGGQPSLNRCLSSIRGRVVTQAGFADSRAPSPCVHDMQ